MLEYDKQVVWLEKQCRMAFPEVDWHAVSKLEMLLRGWWNEEFPMFRIMGWAYRADGTEKGLAVEISDEFMDLDEKGAVEMALEAGQRLAEFAKEE